MSIRLICFKKFGLRNENAAEVAALQVDPGAHCVEVSAEGVKDGINFAKTQCKNQFVIWLGETPQKEDRLIFETVAENVLESDPNNKQTIVSGAPLKIEWDRSQVSSLDLLKPYVTLSSNCGRFFCNMALFLMITQNIKGVFVHVPISMNKKKAFDLLHGLRGVLGICYAQKKIVMPLRKNDKLYQLRYGRLEQMRASERAVITYVSPMCMPCKTSFGHVRALHQAFATAQQKGTIPGDVAFRIFNMDTADVPDVDSTPTMIAHNNSLSQRSEIPFRSFTPEKFVEEMKRLYERRS